MSARDSPFEDQLSVFIGSRLDLDFMGERPFGGYSIVGSVVTFRGGDDPSPFQQFRGDDSFGYRAQLFIIVGYQRSPWEGRRDSS